MPLLFNNNHLTNYKKSYYALIMTQKQKLFTPQHPLTNHHPYQQNKKTGPSTRTIQHSNH